jgi:serine/threonine protein kinase
MANPNPSRKNEANSSPEPDLEYLLRVAHGPMREVTDTTTFTPLRRGAHFNAQSLGDTNPYTTTGFRLYRELPKGIGTEKLGSGEVDAIVGDGTLTRVYTIISTARPRLRVVKIAFPGLPDEIASTLRHRWEMWRSLSHPTIPRVFETGTHNNLPFAEMEHVSGRSLQSMLELHSRLPPHVSTSIALMVAQGISHCLGKATPDGRVRCLPSVEPRDVILGKNGVVKLTELLLPGTLAQSGYTSAEQTLDLARYLSPESTVSRRFDADDGSYEVGALLYLVLTGHPPFHKNVFEAMQRAKERGARIPLRSRIFASPSNRLLLRLCSACLAPDATSRPPFEVLLEELKGIHAHITRFSAEQTISTAVNDTEQWPPARS